WKGRLVGQLRVAAGPGRGICQLWRSLFYGDRSRDAPLEIVRAHSKTTERNLAPVARHRKGPLEAPQRDSARDLAGRTDPGEGPIRERVDRHEDAIHGGAEGGVAAWSDDPWKQHRGRALKVERAGIEALNQQRRAGGCPAL